MGKESQAGTKFYASAGLKSITVHLPKAAHKKLVKLAKKEERSFQRTIRRILVDYAKKHSVR